MRAMMTENCGGRCKSHLWLIGWLAVGVPFTFLNIMFFMRYAYGADEAKAGAVTETHWRTLRSRNCPIHILVVAADKSGTMNGGVSGDALWASSLSQVLLRIPDAHVDFVSPHHLPNHSIIEQVSLLKRGLPHDEGVVGDYKDRLALFPFENRRFRFLDPFARAPCTHFRGMPLTFPTIKELVRYSGGNYLNDQGVFAMVQHLNKRFKYQWILIRDQPQREYAETLLSDPSLAKKMWVFGLDRPLDLSPKFISSKNAWRAVLSPIHFENGVYNPDVHGKKMKTLWLPPILPSSLTVAKGERALPPPRTSAVNHRVCSIGSFPPPGHDYLITEMVEGFQLVRKRVVDAELLLILTRYEERVDDTLRSLISSTAGVTLLPSIPHDEALRYYREECDIGVRGYRDDERQVLSTKVIEMASTGMPVIINPSKIHELVFGSDYKGLWSYTNVNAAESFADVVSSLLLDSEVFHIASRQVLSGMGPYTADNIAGNLYRALPSGSCSSSISRTLRSPIAIHCPSVHLLFGCLTLREAFDSSFGYASRVLLEAGDNNVNFMRQHVRTAVADASLPASSVEVLKSVKERLPSLRLSLFVFFSPLGTGVQDCMYAVKAKGVPMTVVGSGFRSPLLDHLEELDRVSFARLVRDVLEVKPLAESGVVNGVYFVGSLWPDVFKAFYHQSSAESRQKYNTSVVMSFELLDGAAVKERQVAAFIQHKCRELAQLDATIVVAGAGAQRLSQLKVGTQCDNVVVCSTWQCPLSAIAQSEAVVTDSFELAEAAVSRGKKVGMVTWDGHTKAPNRFLFGVPIHSPDKVGAVVKAMRMPPKKVRAYMETDREGMEEMSSTRIVTAIESNRCFRPHSQTWGERTTLVGTTDLAFLEKFHRPAHQDDEKDEKQGDENEDNADGGDIDGHAQAGGQQEKQENKIEKQSKSGGTSAKKNGRQRWCSRHNYHSC
mmetsp:Transcript_34366/g.88867  ORF Transcript_34366/g.88867 Transcript_34366/m.88867 type:complete len:949 (-) Transcript_34366:1066-3912(-)